LRDVYKHHGRHRGGRPSRRARAARPPYSCWFPTAARLSFHAQIFAYPAISVKQNASLIAQHCRIALFMRPYFRRLSKPNPGATAVLVDEFDAGRFKCPSDRSDRLRPHAKPVSYLFFLGVLAVRPRTTFGAADGLDAAAASADLAEAALVRRTPG
jgi:hypothetical protein